MAGAREEGEEGIVEGGGREGVGGAGAREGGAMETGSRMWEREA